MPDSVFKMVELVGTSPKSIEEAVSNALRSRAAKKASILRWFQIVETRGAIKDGKIAEWQVTVKIGEHAEA